MAATHLAAEERIVLRNVSWDTYESLMRDHEHSSYPRFTYDRGVLEIMSPLPLHDRFSRLIDLFVTVVAEELGTDAYGLGSTTFKRNDLQRGFEADACFYLQHQEDVRGKARLDPHVDPPPDLVVEVDISHSSLDKLPIYRQFGVPEVWRFDGARLSILATVAEGEYGEQARSQALPAVTSAALTSLLSEGIGLSNVAWMRRVRAWLRGQALGGES
jgi:Uma2 family endonuclease